MKKLKIEKMLVISRKLIVLKRKRSYFQQSSITCTADNGVLVFYVKPLRLGNGMHVRTALN